MKLKTSNPGPAALLTLGSLPIEVRREIDDWCAALAGVAKPYKASLEKIAARLGVSAKTARRKWDAWRKSGGDPLSLVNRSKVVKRETTLPPEFVEHLRALNERSQRKFRPAHRNLLRAWRQGETIPGYPPDAPRHKNPDGWSYSNLTRHLGTRFETTAMRVGLVAASRFGPRIFSTRVGLWPASHYMFDDMWHDHYVSWKGRAVRPLEFDCLDLFSGCLIGWGMSPRYEREDGSMAGLGERYMRMLLASVLRGQGYSPRGTALVVEHGTAAIRDRIEQLLSDRTGGLVTVSRSGMVGDSLIVAGMGRGARKGNPAFKAALESIRNLKHNELGFLEAQTGKDVDHRPESTHGTLKYTETILKAAIRLLRDHPERAMALRVPMMEWFSQWLPLSGDIYARINERTWHDLEGWAACGHVAIDYRLSPEHDAWLGPQEFLALPEVSQQLLITAAQADNRYLRQRKLSPQEVWGRGRPQLTPIPEFVVAEILGDDFAAERAVKGSYFEFHDSEISPEELRYESRITTPEGRAVELRDGEKFLVFANPLDLECLFVHDAKGAYLGRAARVTRITRGDTDALNHAFGAQARRQAELLQPLRSRHSQFTRDSLGMLAHNNRAQDTQTPFTDAEKARDRALRAVKEDFTAIPADEPNPRSQPDEPYGATLEELDAL